MNRYGILLVGGLAALLLAACASSPRQARVDAALALVEQHAGAPVHSVQRLASVRFSDYESFGDQHLLLWEGVSRAWLLEVEIGCFNLDSAFRVAVVQQSAWLDTSGSYILAGDQQCRIRSIRPVDAKALRLARQQARADGKQ